MLTTTFYNKMKSVVADLISLFIESLVSYCSCTSINRSGQNYPTTVYYGYGTVGVTETVPTLLTSGLGQKGKEKGKTKFVRRSQRVTPW